MLPQDNPHDRPHSKSLDASLLDPNKPTLNLLEELKHPIFASTDNPIINCFKDLVQKEFKIERGKSGLVKLFFDFIFENTPPQDLKSIYEERGLSFDAVCGKIITKNTTFYMCLDCDKLRKNDSALICCLCKECFLKSNHKGHRVLMSTNNDDTSSACDCGDSAVFEKQGFCSSHSRHAIDIDSLIKDIGTDIVANFNNIIGAAFYGVFAFVELLPQVKEKALVEKTLPLNLIHDLCKATDLCLGEIMGFCETLISKVNSAFIPIIGNFLQSKLPEKHRTLMHNCNEYRKPIYTTEECQCTCTVCDLIIKNISAFFPTFQDFFIQFCNNIGKYEHFKEYMAVAFMRNIYFIFYQDNPKYRSKEAASLFAKANVHFYTNVDLCDRVVKSSVINNIFDLISDIIGFYTEPNYHFTSLVWELKSILKCLLRPQQPVCVSLIRDKKIASIFLEYLVKHREVHPYPGPIFSDMTGQDVNLLMITRNLGVEGILEAMFKRIIVQLVELTLEEKASLYQELTNQWRTCFYDYIGKKKYQEISFLPGLERAANVLIRDSDLSITKEKVEKFLKEMSEETISKNSETLLQGTIIQMGATRKIYLIDAKTRSDVGFMYFNDEYCMFDTDVTSIQMLVPWIPSENVFSYIVNNWFQYSSEISEYVLTENEAKLSKDSLKALEDFLSLLVFIMIDEICYSKLKVTKDPKSVTEMIEFSSDVMRVTRKILISLLATHYWVDFNVIKDNMRMMLCESSLETVLPEVTLKEEKTNRIRLKEEYYSQVDPFLFSHKKLLQKDVLNMLQGSEEKKNKIDVVSGIYYTDLPYHCYETQKNLFESNLPMFLGKVISLFDAENELLLRPVLRLISTHLQAISWLDKKGENVTKMQENLKSYTSKNFLQNLEKIKENDNLSDCHASVKKIEALLKEFTTTSAEKLKKIEVESAEGTPEKDQALSKKQLAEQKMKALKEEFLKKQNAFKATLETQKDTNQINTEEESKENILNKQEVLQCNICLQDINTDTELYGILCYLTFTSTLTLEPEILPQNPQSTEDFVFPVLHSCGHVFHQKCFKPWEKKTRSPQGPYHILLNPSETYCPFCSSLANLFCPINQKENTEELEAESPQGTTEDLDNYEKLTIHERNRMLRKLGSLKIFAASRNPTIFTANTPENNTMIIKEAIAALKNMYWLYVNSVNFESHDQFAKKFSLYANFLRCIKKQFKLDKEAFEQAKKEIEDQPEGLLIVNIIGEILENPDFLPETIVAHAKNYIQSRLQKQENEGSSSILSRDLKQLLQKILILFALWEYQCKDQVNNDQLLENIMNCSESPVSLDFCFNHFGIGKVEDFLTQVRQIKNSTIIESASESQDLQKVNLVSDLKPKVVVLPPNYQEFLDKYMNHLCSYCNDMPAHGEKLICLLCGDVLCKTRCAKKISNSQLGTANIHSLEHCGFGFYLEVFYLGLVFINFPKNIIARKKHAFIDESGQSITSLIYSYFDKRLDTLDFKKFTLNPETLNYINTVTRESLVPLELFVRARDSANHTKIIAEGVL